MSETFVGLLQGIATGVGILVAGAGIFFAGPVSGNFQLMLNDQVVAINRPVVAAAGAQPVSVVKMIAAPDAPEAVQVEPEAVVSEPEAVSRVASIQFTPDPVYYNQTAADLYLMVVSLQRMKTLLDAPRPESEGWRTEIGSLVSAVRLSADNLPGVQPAEAKGELHGVLVNAASRCTNLTLGLEGDLLLVPTETFQTASDPIDGCSADIIAVLQAIS